MKPDKEQALQPIILIEDDPDDAHLFTVACQALERQHSVIAFSDPQEALAYLQVTADVPVMIIADINMPKIDGMELRKLMRQTSSMAMRTVPFFFLTTNASDRKLAIEYYGLLVQGCFTKPVAASELTAMVQSMLSYCDRINAAALPVPEATAANGLLGVF